MKKTIIDPWIDRLQDHPMGRNPNTLVHILGALHPRSGVAIRHVLRKLQSSSPFKCQGARIIISLYQYNNTSIVDERVQFRNQRIAVIRVRRPCWAGRARS